MGLEGEGREGSDGRMVELRGEWYEEGRTLTGLLPRPPLSAQHMAAMGQGQTWQPE